MRALLLLVVLAIAVGAILMRLWTNGFPLRTAAKLTVLSAGFVVSIKMALGGYLSLQGDGDTTLAKTLGFYGSLGLVLFFGGVTLSLWRRRASNPSSDA